VPNVYVPIINIIMPIGVKKKRGGFYHLNVWFNISTSFYSEKSISTIIVIVTLGKNTSRE